eukprot:scaffold9361_cov26-Phaeocystis_antarctica.AAC.1
MPRAVRCAGAVRGGGGGGSGADKRNEGRAQLPVDERNNEAGAVHSARMRVAVHPQHAGTKITSNDTSKLQRCVVSLQRNDLSRRVTFPASL